GARCAGAAAVRLRVPAVAPRADRRVAAHRDVALRGRLLGARLPGHAGRDDRAEVRTAAARARTCDHLVAADPCAAARALSAQLAALCARARRAEIRRVARTRGTGARAAHARRRRGRLRARRTRPPGDARAVPRCRDRFRARAPAVRARLSSRVRRHLARRERRRSQGDRVNRHPVFDPGILDGVQLLEADAGTGKTWTIAGLVVRALVERGLELDRVLVVTFTNAAAAELAERIRLRIAQLERLLDDRLEGRAGEGAGVDEPFCTAYAATLDDAAARRARDVLRVALARVDELSVHTIHAWCQRVIDEHALSIGVARALPIGAGDGERIAARVADWWRREVLDAPVERLALFALAG